MNACRADQRSHKKIFLLKVVSYQDCIPRGYVTVFPAAVPLPFCGLIDMIHKTEAAPQPGEEDPPYPEPGRQENPLATFLVTLCFEQHASWQGSVCWVEKQKKHLFRSELELIEIMDRILGKQKAEPSVLKVENSDGGETTKPGKKGTS